MAKKPPKPLCKTFMVCRRIVMDQYTKEHVLIAPLFQVYTSTFPLIADVSIFVRLTEGNGVYHLELQLQTLEGDIVWRDGLEPALEVRDPLAIGLLDLQHRRIYVPKPGKYELVLFANGDEIFRDLLSVLAPPPPGVPPIPQAED